MESKTQEQVLGPPVQSLVLQVIFEDVGSEWGVIKPSLVASGGTALGGRDE